MYLNTEAQIKGYSLNRVILEVTKIYPEWDQNKEKQLKLWTLHKSSRPMPPSWSFKNVYLTSQVEPYIPWEATIESYQVFPDDQGTLSLNLSPY